MKYLTRTFLVFFVLLLWTEIKYVYQNNVQAQDSEAEQDTSPTIPHADVIYQLLDFANQSDADCQLPCFYEIRFDETTLSEIQELSTALFEEDETILAQFETPFERHDGLLDYTLRFNSRDVTGSFTLSFIFSPEETVLRRFYTRLNHPENWLQSSELDLSEVLQVLGEPNDVYISISGAEPPYFNIVLSYKDLGTLIRYTYFFEPNELTQGEEPISLCGNWSKTYSIDVWLQANDENFYDDLLDENLRLSEGENTQETVYRAFWSLERITSWNIEDLTDYLVENPEWCFEALSYEELLDLGYSY